MSRSGIRNACRSQRRHRDVAVHRRHQLQDRLRRVVLPFPSRALVAEPDDRICPRETCTTSGAREPRAHQVQQLRVVHHVPCSGRPRSRERPLPREKDVLRVWASAVRRAHDQDRTVLWAAPVIMFLMCRRGPGSPVRVVAIRGLVLHVRRVDRDPALPFLGGVVDLVVRLERDLRVPGREHLGIAAVKDVFRGPRARSSPRSRAASTGRTFPCPCSTPRCLLLPFHLSRPARGGAPIDQID